ncbi:lytic polysaccharide monooxygenase [Corallococcus exiguus]|uniref:lytic polysaccharide monooxygenase auxiliary activity family 9 protein n=1 Tax=Corallococcus exiguus TaxID=83462 RepID=UPI001A90C754|nr:lytic polysaccharide monooxygenase [Corallococcus exiguus]MBN8469213.1 lytic polysaccharide monooxygenase [Corallococcus exiguus]
MFPAIRKAFTASLAFVSLLSAGPAAAHGSMEVPLSRVYGCFKEGPESPKSAACKAAVQTGGTQALYDWNGVRQGAANGRHREIIPDGKLCSAANESHKGLDLARADWPSTLITPDSGGRFEFVFHATAVHATGYFQLFVTKEGYNPSLPLKWSDLESTPFCNVTNVSAVNNRYRLNCPFPATRTGSHVIYAIWQRADSPEAFYACTDVKFSNTPPPPVSWKELGQVQAREDLPKSSKVTFRLFDSAGRDAESYPLTLDAATPAATWMYRLAQQVNAGSSRVQVGVLQTSGSVTPVQDALGNRVYSKETGYSFQVDIEKPSTGGGNDGGTGGSAQYKYPAGIDSYTAGTLVEGTDGLIYRCKPFPYSGWCKGAASHYAPGTGMAWQDAWERAN